MLRSTCLGTLYLVSMLLFMLVFGSICLCAPCHVYVFRSTCWMLCLVFGFVSMSLVTPLSCALALSLGIDLDLRV